MTMEIMKLVAVGIVYVGGLQAWETRDMWFESVRDKVLNTLGYEYV